MPTRHRLAFATILLVALTARLVFAGWVVGWHAPDEGEGYHALAKNIAEGRGFVSASGRPTARLAPAYPALLAAAYKITGPSRAVARALQVALGVVLVALALLIGSRYFGRGAGFAAAVLAAINPFLVFACGQPLCENLYLVLVLAAFVCVPVPSLFTGGMRRVALGAALLALAALTRPGAAVLALWVFGLGFLFAGAGWGRRWVRLGVAVAVFVAVTLPWVVRNSVTFGGWVGITTSGGVLLFQANNPRTLKIESLRGAAAPLASLPRYDELAAMNERDADRLAADMAGQFARHRWRSLPKMAGWKLERFWSVRGEGGRPGAAPAARLQPGLLYAIFALPLCVVGLFLSRSRWRELVFLYGVAVVHTLAAVIYYGSMRLRVPLEPVIAVFAAAAVVAAVRRLHPSPGDRPAPSPDRGGA